MTDLKITNMKKRFWKWEIWKKSEYETETVNTINPVDKTDLDSQQGQQTDLDGVDKTANTDPIWMWFDRSIFVHTLLYQ